jgi:hypothetical protein
MWPAMSAFSGKLQQGSSTRVGGFGRPILPNKSPLFEKCPNSRSLSIYWVGNSTQNAKSFITIGGIVNSMLNLLCDEGNALACPSGINGYFPYILNCLLILPHSAGNWIFYSGCGLRHSTLTTYAWSKGFLFIVGTWLAGLLW